MNEPGAPARSILDQPRLPLNRILTLVGPYISLVSGGLAAWLSQNFPGLVSNAPATTKEITQGVTFVVGALITWALQHRYLVGWQAWEQGLMDVEKAARAMDGADKQATAAGSSGGDGYYDDATGGYNDGGASGDGEPAFNADLIYDPTTDQPR